jgi:hypothetical protein
VAGSALFAQVAFAQIIEGTVVDSVTGEPVSEASVQIGSAGNAAYQTVSDAQGAFHIDGVADGTYMAIPFKTGFQTPGDAAALRPFRVGAGLDSVHLRLLLIPLGKLSGRLFDANDRPIAGAEVNMLQGVGIGQTVTSDEKGGFVFDGVRPGGYLLSARPPSDMKPPAPVGDEHYGWAKTWFPGVAEAAAAQKIQIRAGAELVGQDIKLRAVPVHGIHGMIRDSDGDPAPNLPITVALAGELKPVDQHAVSGKDGSFELHDLADGKWQLSAEKTSGAVTLRALMAVTITGRDTDGVELQLNPPFSVPVEFLAATQDSTTKIQSNVRLEPEWGGQTPAGSADPGGNYNIAGVYPGRYLVSPFPPAGFYLASITLGDQDVLGQMVEFTAGSVPLKVVYRSDGGSIRATVEECGSATIAIAPEDPVLQPLGMSWFGRCTADGHFEIRKLRPGRYYAFAFDQLDQNASAFLSSLPALINTAVTVEVKANETANVELHVTAGPIP